MVMHIFQKVIKNGNYILIDPERGFFYIKNNFFSLKSSIFNEMHIYRTWLIIMIKAYKYKLKPNATQETAIK